jgi:hypothetical protein
MLINKKNGLDIRFQMASKMVILRKAIPAILIVGMLSAESIDQQIVKAQQQQRNEVDWEQLCIQYGRLVGIHTPCSELAHGTFLTEKVKTSLVCLFGGGTLLLLGIDPTTVAMIGKAAPGACP